MDKGVSAVGQVVAVRLKSNIPLNATWDEEGKQPVTNDNEGKLPKNSFDKIQLWVPPKPKKKEQKNPKEQCYRKY